jgi:hypothetical protein
LFLGQVPTGGRKSFSRVADEVLKLSFEMANKMPSVIDSIERMKNFALSLEQQRVFAQKAAEIRGSSLAIELNELLKAERPGDEPEYDDGRRSVWRTFNVVQEHLTKGGLIGMTVSGRHNVLRGIKSCDEDYRINKQLWKLADEQVPA